MLCRFTSIGCMMDIDETIVLVRCLFVYTYALTLHTIRHFFLFFSFLFLFFYF